jgi:hypothetical protein
MSKFKTIESFFKRKEVVVPLSNTLLDFNAKTSNFKERLLKSQRVEAEEHPSESLIVETQEILTKLMLFLLNGIQGHVLRCGLSSEST